MMTCLVKISRQLIEDLSFDVEEDTTKEDRKNEDSDPAKSKSSHSEAGRGTSQGDRSG